MGIDGFVPHPNDNHFRLKSESAFVTQLAKKCFQPQNQPTSPTPKTSLGQKPIWLRKMQEKTFTGENAMRKVKGGKFLQSWCGLLEVQETQWSHELVRCEGFKEAQSSIHWLPEFEDCLEAESWWLLDLVVWEARGWVESKGCANSGRGQDEWRRRDIALFPLFIGGCIDETHRRSHGLPLDSVSTSTVSKPLQLSTTIKVWPFQKQGFADNWMDWQVGPAPVCVHAPDKAAPTLPRPTSTVQTNKLNPPLMPASSFPCWMIHECIKAIYVAL